MVDQWLSLETALQQRIRGDRLAHVYRVVDTVVTLAQRFGVDEDQAAIAGLLHDYAKAMSGPDLLATARQRGLLIDPAESIQPLLLHGPVAAALLAEEGLVTDLAILDAIRWHTTGCEGMSTLAKVVWLADYIEPGRKFDGVEPVRALAAQNLDGALLMALNQTITFVIGKGWHLHLSTVKARNWLLGQIHPPTVNSSR